MLILVYMYFFITFNIKLVLCISSFIFELICKCSNCLLFYFINLLLNFVNCINKLSKIKHLITIINKKENEKILLAKKIITKNLKSYKSIKTVSTCKLHRP